MLKNSNFFCLLFNLKGRKRERKRLKGLVGITAMLKYGGIKDMTGITISLDLGTLDLGMAPLSARPSSYIYLDPLKALCLTWGCISVR